MKKDKETPLELYIQREQYRLAEKIDQRVAIYIKPRAWYIPKFIYHLFIKKHVQIVTFDK